MGRSPGASYAAQKERYWGLPVPEGIAHGPSTFASKAYGCPCDKCLPSGQRTWKNTEGASGPVSPTDRGRKLRETKRGQPVPPGVKHGVYARNVYGCPCSICKGAASEQRRRSRAAWRARARGRWALDTERKMDVICWPPRGAGPDWKCPHPDHTLERAA